MAGNIQRCAGGIKRCTGGIKRCGGGCPCLDSAVNVLATFSGVTADCCIFDPRFSLHERIFGMTDASFCLPLDAPCNFNLSGSSSPWIAYSGLDDCPPDPAGRSDDTEIDLEFLPETGMWRIQAWSASGPGHPTTTEGDFPRWFFADFSWDCQTDITVSNQILACEAGFTGGGGIGATNAIGYGGSVTISVNACPPPVVRTVLSMQQVGDSAVLVTFDGPVTVVGSIPGADVTGIDDTVNTATASVLSQPSSTTLIIAYTASVASGDAWGVTGQPAGISETITLRTTGTIDAFAGVTAIAATLIDSSTISWQFSGPVTASLGGSSGLGLNDTTGPNAGFTISAQPFADTITVIYADSTSASGNAWAVQGQPPGIDESVYIGTRGVIA